MTLPTQSARLAQLRAAAAFTLEELSARLARYGPKARKSPMQLNRYEKDDTIRIKAPALNALAAVYRTTPDYIRTGQAANEHAPPASSAHVLTAANDLNYVTLPFIPAAAYHVFAAGPASYLTELNATTTTMRLLARPGLNYDEAVIIEISGNAMAPRYPDRACYVVRPVPAAAWAYATGVHLLALLGETVLVKRITANANEALTLSNDAGGAETRVELASVIGLWKLCEAVYLPAED